MKMKKSIRSLVLAAGIASATALGCNFALADTTAAPAQAQGEHKPDCQKGKHQRGHHRFAKLAKKLALTDQQKTQVKAIFQDNRAQAKPLFTSMMTERRQLRKLVESGTADEAAIRAESAKVAAIQADLAVQRAKGAKQFMALLTPDQQAKLAALKAEREQKHQGFRGHEGRGHEGRSHEGEMED
jgi:periplasmic protein CpxP/Spy